MVDSFPTTTSGKPQVIKRAGWQSGAGRRLGMRAVLVLQAARSLLWWGSRMQLAVFDHSSSIALLSQICSHSLRIFPHGMQKYRMREAAIAELGLQAIDS